MLSTPSTYLSRSLSLLRCWKKEGSQMSWFSWHTCLQDWPGSASFTCRALRGGHITCPWQKSYNDKGSRSLPAPSVSLSEASTPEGPSPGPPSPAVLFFAPIPKAFAASTYCGSY